jgi:hypothetical protein
VRGYKLRHFDLRELVTPEIWEKRGARCIELLDPRALRVLDDLRDTFGPVIVNNWHRGGGFTESGLRDPHTTTGAAWSQHKFGRAFDCKLNESTPREAFDYLLANQADWPEITVLEDIEATGTWLHFDVRAADWDGIRIVKP